MSLLSEKEEAHRLYNMMRSQLMDVVKKEDLHYAVKACCTISIDLAKRSGDDKYWKAVNLELSKIPFE